MRRLACGHARLRHQLCRTFPTENTAHDWCIRQQCVWRPSSNNVEPVLINLVEALLFASGPRFIPRRVNLRDEFFSLYPVASGIGRHRTEKRGLLTVRVSWRSFFRSYKRHHSTVRREDKVPNWISA